MEESGQIWNVVLFLECQSYRINRNEKEKERFFQMLDHTFMFNFFFFFFFFIY